MTILLGLACFAMIATFAAWVAYHRVPRPNLGDRIEMKPRSAGSVSILLVGDVGSGLPAQVKVADLMARLASEHALDAVFLAGDNFINHGVTDTDDPLWQERFQRVYERGQLAYLPFFAVLGNHDYCGNAQAQIDYTFVAPGRWNMPARHYSVAWSDLLEVGCIDTNFPDWSGILSLPLDRLQQRLRRSNAAWRFVVGHRPIFSGGEYRFLHPHLRFIFERFLLGSRANLYVSGHDHCMQHLEFNPMLGKSPINQLVVGTGGSDLRDVEALPGKTRFALSHHGVVRAVISKEEARIFFHSIEQSEPVYQFALSRLNGR